MDNPYRPPQARLAEEPHRLEDEGESTTSSERSWIYACLRLASSIGKGLAVVVAVVAIYIALIVAALYVLLWFVLSDFDIDAY